MAHDPVSLGDYRLLGRSGLRVSPLSLGTMTFGATWGCDAAESARIFGHYVDAGGNFIDTANFYAETRSETILGELVQSQRDRLVIATKYSLGTQPGDPNSGGNHRKSMMRSIEDSLKRLRTDYIDLFYLHIWDFTTSVDEIMRGLDDLVRQGKVLYLGISDTPAWEVSRMQTLAELRGWSTLAGLQIEYNLIQRTAERDLLPMARALGLGVLPWSPLASGVLSGKYGSGQSVEPGKEGDGRRAMIARNGRLNERSLKIADAVRAVADEVGKTPAQVALAWTLLDDVVASPILGVRTLQQLEDNLGALDVVLEPEHLARLDAASGIELGFPHDMLALDWVRGNLTAGTRVRPRTG